MDESNALPPQVRELAAREREIATMIYEDGALTARDIEERLNPTITNASIRSMLTRLTNKGVIRKEFENRARSRKYLYFPTITPVMARRKALRKLSNQFFDGSMVRMASEILEVLEEERTKPARRRSRSLQR